MREGAEFDLIRAMLQRWGGRATGVGDDAALLRVPAGALLVASTDSSVENVHFRREWLSAREIGYRATAAALSDLAAMAAEPLGALVAVALPAEWSGAAVEIADGVGEAVESAGTVVLGGDVSSAGELSLTVTVLGAAENPLLRSAARPGDHVYVTGRLGGPFAALRDLRAGLQPDAAARERFARPVPRIREARWLAARGVRCGIDISDGLAAELEHLARASAVVMTVELDRVPCAPGVSPVDAAGSGEEYELLVTSAEPLDTQTFADELGLELTRIGTVEAGVANVTLLLNGTRVPSPPGYLHFA